LTNRKTGQEIRETNMIDQKEKKQLREPLVPEPSEFGLLQGNLAPFSRSTAKMFSNEDKKIIFY
jgi:hypothetical protein